jgi:hypothetical protein
VVGSSNSVCTASSFGYGAAVFINIIIFESKSSKKSTKINGGALFPFVKDQVEPVFPISWELFVAAYEGEVFGYGLGDEHSVAGVAVVFEEREVGEGLQMLFGDVFYINHGVVANIINNVFR